MRSRVTDELRSMTADNTRVLVSEADRNLIGTQRARVQLMDDLDHVSVIFYRYLLF